MGEYAEYALRDVMRGGMPLPRWLVEGRDPPKRPRCSCVICGKEVEASEGLAAHIKAKHSD